MVAPLYKTNPVIGNDQQPGDRSRLAHQILMGRARFGPSAAREIALRIEEQGGFWGPRVESGGSAE